MSKNDAVIGVAATPRKDTYVKQAVLRALIRDGNANLDLQDNENKTALMRAIEIGDVETVKTLILVYYGARIDIESGPGETALTMAKAILPQRSRSAKKYIFIVRLLENWPKTRPGKNRDISNTACCLSNAKPGVQATKPVLLFDRIDNYMPGKLSERRT